MSIDAETKKKIIDEYATHEVTRVLLRSRSQSLLIG